jgi:tetratricopeptide (TPR) repeat protein
MRSNRNLLLVIALAGVAIAVPALAEQVSDYPPPCDGSRVTKADVDRAHTVFLSGKQYLEEANYDKAISYFKDAYLIDCSVHAMLPIIATAYERKGDKGEAVSALEEYLKRAPNAPDHDVVERRIKNLKDQLAREPPAGPVPPAQTASSSVVAPPAPTAPATIEPPATATASASSVPPPTSQGHSSIPWVITGIGGAVVAVGLVLYVVGAGDVSSAEARCPPPAHSCAGPPAAAASARDQGNKGRSLENAGGPLIGVGAAAVVAGLLWHFLEKPADNQSTSPVGIPRIGPVIAPGYAGVSVGGRF